MTSEASNWIRTDNGTVRVLMWVSDEDLRLRYAQRVAEHNHAVLSSPFPDAGFDLMASSEYVLLRNTTSNKVNFNVKIAAWMTKPGSEDIMPVTMLLMPRSSTGSKTSLRLANSVGVIDSGYRGPIIGVFDNIGMNDHMVHSNDRLCQIMSRNDLPATVMLVSSFEDLGANTDRGEGGFGSTGQ